MGAWQGLLRICGASCAGTLVAIMAATLMTNGRR